MTEERLPHGLGWEDLNATESKCSVGGDTLQSKVASCHGCSSCKDQVLSFCRYSSCVVVKDGVAGEGSGVAQIDLHFTPVDLLVEPVIIM